MRGPSSQSHTFASIFRGAKSSALFGYPVVRVQIPPVAQNGLLASVVRLAKIERVKIPETVDAVGVQPTASKLFGSFVLC